MGSRVRGLAVVHRGRVHAQSSNLILPNQMVSRVWVEGRKVEARDIGWSFRAENFHRIRILQVPSGVHEDKGSHGDGTVLGFPLGDVLNADLIIGVSSGFLGDIQNHGWPEKFL